MNLSNVFYCPECNIVWDDCSYLKDGDDCVSSLYGCIGTVLLLKNNNARTLQWLSNRITKLEEDQCSCEKD